MNKVYFCNDGVFDPRAMLTFGVSVKGDDDAIGYFGTGFKYAIAIILRNGGTVSISSCGDNYNFESRTEDIRGKDVDIVYCNGVNAGFTTHVGINWEPWMAYRELYSNCMDEGGRVSENPVKTDTVIEVDCYAIRLAFNDSDKYFLDDEPLATHGRADIHKKRSNYVYYKGVAVGAMDAAYSYNLKGIDLTEDRTFKHEYQVRWGVQKAVQSLTDKTILRAVLAPGEHYEAKIPFDIDWPISDEFIETASAMMKTNVGVSEGVRSIMKDLSTKKGDWPAFKLSITQDKMLERAVKFLDGIGVNASDFPIVNVSGLGDGVMGRALNGTIYLSDIPYQYGTKQLASTIMEEWVHNKFGCADFDRQMQSWLFDKVLSIGEEINGEPI